MLVNFEEQKQKFLKALNEYRVSKGRKPVQYHPQFQLIADLRVKELVEHKYFSHDRPDGTDIQSNYSFDGLFDESKYNLLGENLAGIGNRTDYRKLLQLWQSSPRHNAGLLDPRAKYIGLSVAEYKHLDKTAVVSLIKGRDYFENPFDKFIIRK